MPHLAPGIDAKITKMLGVKVTVTDRCVGYGTCTQGICFADAIRVVNNRAVRSEECRGCGRCVDVGPQKAIELTIEDDRFIGEAIDRISSSVDVLQVGQETAIAPGGHASTHFEVSPLFRRVSLEIQVFG